MESGVLAPGAIAPSGLEEPTSALAGEVPALPPVVQVLPNCAGLETPLTYAIPPHLHVQAGDILTVPLGSRVVSAIALEVLDRSDASDFDGELKPVLEVAVASPFPPRYWALLAQVADYYRTPLVQVVKAALPPKLMDGGAYRVRLRSPDLSAHEEVLATLSAAARAVAELLAASQERDRSLSRKYLQQKLPRYASRGLRELQQQNLVELSLASPHRPQAKVEEAIALLRPPAEADTPRQREILTCLQRAGGELRRADLIRQAKTTPGAIATLAARGFVACYPREVLRFGGKSHTVVADAPKVLTEAQQAAIAAIAALRPPHQELLLYGVTGSGKTEVYLQAIAPVLQRRQSALVLVPEIGLTPQLADRFRARFGDRRVVLYHSHLSEGERFDTWRTMLSGEPLVVVGTRSAVFAPLPNLGAIVLDEEHDSSFKQDRPQPCYHARTVAQWRSRQEGIPLILGSATPSAEMVRASQASSTAAPTVPCIRLPARIGDRPLPPIAIVDMREELHARNFSIFSRTLQAAIAKTLERQQQAILFVPRRGHNTFVSCRSCGYVMMCPHCDVSLTFHDPLAATPNPQLICHYCNYTARKPERCPECGSPYFKHFGSGTQRVEQEVAKLFPHARALRFDSDTTRNKDSHRLLLERFQQGEADLLIGTQMLAKGLDVPQVTLVGIVTADGLLNLADYRATERAFQTLMQVAGRAGRGDEPGRAIVQTYTPDHPAIQALQAYNYDGFMVTELEHRAQLRYPPCGHMALIHISSQEEAAAIAAAEAIAAALARTDCDWEVLGPAPAAIAKVQNRYRWQVIVKCAAAQLPHLPGLDCLRQWANHREVRLAIDIDPLTML